MVSQRREEIAGLKQQLLDMLDSELPTSDAGASEAVSRARLVLQGVTRAKGGGPTPARGFDPDPMGTSAYDIEMALLEAENTRLLEEAKVLLMRQAILEELAVQHGIIVSKSGSQ